MATPPTYGYGPDVLVLIGDTIADGADGPELGEVQYLHANGDIALRWPTGFKLLRAAEVRLVKRGQP